MNDVFRKNLFSRCETDVNVDMWIFTLTEQIILRESLFLSAVIGIDYHQ